jgi:hypothetical protein
MCNLSVCLFKHSEELGRDERQGENRMRWKAGKGDILQ